MNPNPTLQDRIRGCLYGGAAGDALGYAVEFSGESSIFQTYGPNGITSYDYAAVSDLAMISDDTQMTLFTANGLLYGETRLRCRGLSAKPRIYIAKAYQDWLRTQNERYSKARVDALKPFSDKVSWLCDVPGLYSPRAPGGTCLSSLYARSDDPKQPESFIADPKNRSKGCGGVMRVAPLALRKWERMEDLDTEAAEAAAITHGHPMGYMTASVLCHIIQRIVFPDGETRSLKELVLEARDAMTTLFSDRCPAEAAELAALMDEAVLLSENSDCDLENIHRLGEGWIAEEALIIALYCALRHEHDFSAGIIAAVNHMGDSDSTGAITGNILGALHGYEAMEDKWKDRLELSDVILEMADDLFTGCPISEFGSHTDEAWEHKYIHVKWI